MIYTKSVTRVDGKPVVVFVEGSPFDRTDPLPALLIEQRTRIAEMIEAHGPANILYIASDILREESAHADTQPVYKELYQALHEHLETLINEFVQVKLKGLAKAVEM